MRRCLLVATALLMSLAVRLTAAQTAVPTLDPELTQPLARMEFFEVEVINTYPHDTGAFTQGLLWHDGTLYESAGQTGQSNLRQVDLESGEVLRQVDNAPEDFAEGLALVDDRLFQLTWRQEIAYVYDLETFEQMDILTYPGEGWGLCYDGEVLWRSDGTQILTAHDPQTFDVVSELPVTYQGYALNRVSTESGRLFSQLNELECVDGFIYANVWFTDYILRIDTESGEVTGIIDASGLLTDRERAALEDVNAVLNGIAYNPDSETFLLTGKYWPKLFEVEFTPVATSGG